MDEISHRLSVKDLLGLSLRIFKTKPIRTFLTIFGMSVGIGTVLFLISLGYGLQYILIGKLVTTEDSLRTLEAFYPSESDLTIDYQKLEEISKLLDIEETSPVADFTEGEIKLDESTGLSGVKIIRPNFFRLSGLKPDIGSEFKEDDPGVILTNQAAKLLNLAPDNSSLGKEATIKIFIPTQTLGQYDELVTKRPLPIKGIISDELQPPLVYALSDSLSKEPPFFRSILMKAKDIENIEKLRDEIIGKGFLISARLDLVNQATKVMNIITTVLGIFGIAALIVSAIGMFNTMIVGFLERIYEVGIMKSLGATDRDIKNLFLMESFMMGFLGGAGGIILGVGGGQLANLGLNILARSFGGKPFTLFVAPFWFMVATLILSSIIGVVSGFWPARRASGLSPREAFVRK